MKAKKSKGTNEKLIGGIAALAVAAVCVSVYFGAQPGRGGYDEPAPEGVAFAAPDASDGHISIDDGAVPLSDSPLMEDELLTDEALSDGDFLNEDTLNDNSDMLSDELLLDDSDMLDEDSLIGNSDSGNSGSEDLLIEEPGDNSNGTAKDKNTSDKDKKKSGNDAKGSDKGTDVSDKDKKDSEKNTSDKDKNDSEKSEESVAALDNLMLKKINDLRASVGAGKLSIDPTLNKYAAVRAQEASVNWSHTRPNGSQGCDMISSSKYRAENLSCRSYSSFKFSDKEQENAASAMFDNLKSSSMHYDNMTYKNFTKIGISTYVTKTSDGKTKLTTAYMFSN